MFKKVYITKSNNIMPQRDPAHSLPWKVQQIIHFKASNRPIVAVVSIIMKDALLFLIVMIYRDIKWFIEFFARNLVT